MIPKILKILGHEYEVVFHKQEDTANPNAGNAWGRHNKVWIDEEQSKSRQETTLLHEIIEQIDCLLDIGLKHTQIIRLETGLYQVLRDNKPWITPIIK